MTFDLPSYVYLFHPGVDIKEVQEMVENHLKEMILKHFDPKKADSIFSDEGEVYTPEVQNLCYPNLHCLNIQCCKILFTHFQICISLLFYTEVPLLLYEPSLIEINFGKCS